MPVFQKTYDLYRLLHEEVKKFPKSDRHTLGERCKITALDILEQTIRAGSAKKEWKVPPIEDALVRLEILKVLVRLAYETGCLPEKRYLDIQERLREIGRMFGGWRKSI